MVRLLLGLPNSSYTRYWFQKPNLLTSTVFLNSVFLFLFYLTRSRVIGYSAPDLTHSTCLTLMVHGEGSYHLLLYCTSFRRRTIPWRALVHSVLSPFGPMYCNHSLVSSFSWHIRQSSDFFWIFWRYTIYCLSSVNFGPPDCCLRIQTYLFFLLRAILPMWFTFVAGPDV